MKNLKTPLAALAILLAVSSCKKDDLQHTSSSETNLETVSPTQSSGIQTTEWTATSEWSKIERPAHLVFHTNMPANVTAETAEQGLVRVYASTPDGEKSLPFETMVNGQKQYWYYQVTEGNVMIAIDVYGSTLNPGNGLVFKTVILEKKAVEDFRAKGTSADDLMTLSLQSFQIK